MGERFAKIERQVGKLLEDLNRLKRENVTLRAESAKLNSDLQSRLKRADTSAAKNSRYQQLKEANTHYKEERTKIRKEARALLKRVRALKKGGGV